MIWSHLKDNSSADYVFIKRIYARRMQDGNTYFPVRMHLKTKKFTIGVLKLEDDYNYTIGMPHRSYECHQRWRIWKIGGEIKFAVEKASLVKSIWRPNNH